MKLSGKKVKMMRCHISPMLEAKPLQAHMFGKGQNQLPWEAVINDSENGVVVTIPQSETVKEARQWFVPFTNIQTLQFVDAKPAPGKGQKVEP